MAKQSTGGNTGWKGKPATFPPVTGRKDTAPIDKAADEADLDEYEGPIDEGKLSTLGARTLAGFQAKFGIAPGNLKFQKALEAGTLDRDKHFKSNAIGTPKHAATLGRGK